MIVDAVLGWLFTMVTWAINLLPVINLDLSGLHELDSYCTWIGTLVDVPALSAMAAWIASCEVALWVYRAIFSVRQLRLF